MPFLAAISTIDFPHKASQQAVKEYSRGLFAASFPQIDRLLPAFDNTEIDTRNFCKPLDSYKDIGSFKQRNDEYINLSLEYSMKAIEDVLKKAGLKKEELTDIIFVSSTGLATPSLDALLINRMQLPANLKRTPVFGLGCAGGVSGFAKACTAAKANTKAVVLLVAVELCSLTFLKNDYSKSNFIASTLFSDGVAAAVIKGDAWDTKNGKQFKYRAAQSKLYYNSEDVMGWEFQDEGFKVLFSQDIPTIIQKNVKGDVVDFLADYDLILSDVRNFIFHPGGRKVLAAYEDALQAPGDFLEHTRDVIRQYGNMSSATVLYVLERFFTTSYEPGYGLMAALGPGFSSEMVLLEMK